MKKKKLFLGSIYVCVIGVMVVSVLLVFNGIKSFLNEKEVLEFTIDDYFSDISPVMKVEDNDEIIRPYVDDSVKIGRYFYDYKGDSKNQESSIIYYENTYIQNNGVDYVNEEDFDVVSVLDGEVVSVEDNLIYGKVVTIKHNDNLKTIYSNIKDVTVKEGYKVSQGEIIGVSSVSKIDNKKSSLLHFEVYYKDNAIDPENIYTLSLRELE